MTDLISEIEKRRKIVDGEIDALFKDREHIIWKNMAWYPQAGGKKLRPFLAMVSCGALGGDEEDGMIPGLSIELIHNFTLVHDDIMDDDDLRRGRETLHKKEGLSTAINVGDALFALSFRLISNMDVEPLKIKRVLFEISHAVLKVAEGQEEDMRFEKTFDITEEEFIEMIEKKTSYLFQAAARSGAIVAGAPDEKIERMGEYARKMGIAFQVQDDYLDLMGEETDLGKPVGSDIRAGKRTLMVIHALEHLGDEDKRRLIEILDGESDQKAVLEAIELLEKNNSIEYCSRLAEEYANGAKEEIQFLPESEYKDILMALVEFMIERAK
ncbi:MAG: polyprenyl synthetase family protein [Candidatus Saliniplasma sp.]